MPTIVSVVNILILIIYFSISICSIINISKLASTKQDLESANLTINSLSILHDSVRSFKHVFDSIVNSIGGYVVNEDMEGLKKYYNQLLEECHKTNNLYALSPKVINHPAIYHMLATKYYEADKENIQINLNVFLDLNEIEARMKIYDFTRILGILLDNAIEAAKLCDKKVINVTFRKQISNDMIVVIIQNTYTNKEVDTEEIYQKGISSKENHSGLGLWKIRQILMRNNNLNLFTTKDDEYFTQQFEIFK
jgi:two-component system sensor histidine kinase AgrC